MPRLLAVCAVASPGGAEVVAVRVLRRLARRGWTVTLTAPGAGPLRETARREGWGFEAVPVGGIARGAGARAVAAFPKVRRLAARHDVVLLNGGVAARVLPAAAGAARTALFVHDLVDRVPPHWHRADVVMTNSRAAAERLATLGGEGRAPFRAERLATLGAEGRGWARAGRPVGLASEVVGVPVELDPPAVDPPWRADPGRPIVGFVGRLEPRKAPLDLVRAAPLIRRARPDARVVLVGADPFAGRGYADAVRQARGVEHHGWVDDAAGLMRHFDVLVVPSREEPFGAVAAEALAAGTPVVATRVGGLPEVVDDGVTGALVPPNRPRELAAATLRVLARRDELGAAAKRRAGRFGAEVFTDRVERLLA